MKKVILVVLFILILSTLFSLTACVREEPLSIVADGSLRQTPKTKEKLTLYAVLGEEYKGESVVWYINDVEIGEGNQFPIYVDVIGKYKIYAKIKDTDIQSETVFIEYMEKDSRPLIIGLSVGGGLFLILVIAVGVFIYKKRRPKAFI